MSKAYFKNSKLDFEKRVYVLLGHRKIKMQLTLMTLRYVAKVCVREALTARTAICFFRVFDKNSRPGRIFVPFTRDTTRTNANTEIIQACHITLRDH